MCKALPANEASTHVKCSISSSKNNVTITPDGGSTSSEHRRIRVKAQQEGRSCGGMKRTDEIRSVNRREGFRPQTKIGGDISAD